VAGKQYYSTADPDCTVEFHGAIASTIPSLIKRLGDWHNDVQRDAVQLIGKLSNHSEWQLNNITAQLIQIAKSSFMKPLHVRFYRLLSSLGTGAVVCEERPFG
jgi:hypothetical protein